MKTKTCSSCSKIKPTTLFAGDKHRPDGLTCQCKICIRQTKRKYRQTEKGKATEKRYQQSTKGRKSQRNRDLKHNFGITANDYNIIFKEQKGCCVICNKHQSELSYRLHVDHDHITKRIRGLLCKLCNSKLGWFEKHKDIILKHLRLQMMLQESNQ